MENAQIKFSLSFTFSLRKKKSESNAFQVEYSALLGAPLDSMESEEWKSKIKKIGKYITP